MKLLHCARTFRKLLLLGLLALPFGAQALPNFSALYGFGDSLSDIGNAADIVAPDFHPLYFTTFPNLIPDRPYEGSEKLTNEGLMWVETLAAKFGVASAPSRLGGDVYAYGGSNSTDGLPGVPDEHPVLLSVAEQVALFLSDHGNVAASDALYTFTVGGNDVRDALEYHATNPAGVQAVIQTALGSIVDSLTSLALAGARDLLILNVPNLGVAPQVTLLDSLLPGTAAAFSQVSALYATSLDAALQQLVASLALGGIDLNLMLIDGYGILTEVVSNPAGYGFANAVDSCLGFFPTPPCADPDSYVFWDGIHPTIAMHDLIAAQALALIPAPATLPLLALGMVGGWWVRRRHAPALFR